VFPILFEWHGFAVRTYGVVVALALLSAVWIASKEARRRGLAPALVQDFVPYALVAGIVGARLYYVLFSRPGYFHEHPLAIFAVWQGGIGVIGSLIGISLAALWYCRRKGLSVLTFGDILAPGIAFAQVIGQFACLANGDSYGRPTDLPWAIVYTDPRSLAPLNVQLHPIEIYEMFAYFFVFLAVWTSRKRLPRGTSLFTYLIAYGIARFIVEFFRGNPATLWGIPTAQVFAPVLVAAGLIGLLLVKAKERGEVPMPERSDRSI
jgi:phosphatidylglycerol:prolipoprotein diacylglycerol transferase